MSRYRDPEYAVNRRRRLILEGLCPECCAKREDTAFTLCLRCRTRRRLWHAKPEGKAS